MDFARFLHPQYKDIHDDAKIVSYQLHVNPEVSSFFEDIHPFRSNQSRFNSSQFLTSSMIDLSSYNNQTKSSHAKIAHLTNPNTRPTTANVYSETRSTHLMQIEHVPRLRTPAWRTIS